MFGMTFAEAWTWIVFTFIPLALNFVIIFLITCFFTFLIPRGVSLLLVNSGIDVASVRFWESVAGLLTFSIGFVLSFQAAEINIVGIGVTFGAVSFIVGVSVKDIFPNIFASLIIQRLDHYCIGSYVLIDDTAGFIEDITMQQTCIHVFDTTTNALTNRRLYVPNSDLLTVPITIIKDDAKMKYYEIQRKRIVHD